MYKRKIFLINQSLGVFSPEEKIYYQSVIEELTDSYLVIGMPLYRRRQLYLDKGTAWNFCLTRKDSLYFFRSKCLGQKREGQLTLFLIARPKQIKRVQRRRYYRFPCTLEARYWVLAGSPAISREQATAPRGEPENAVIVDISGGGVQLITARRLPASTVLLLTLNLENKNIKKSITVKGKVVRQWSHHLGPQRRFRHAVKYVDIPESLRETIVRMLFVLTRERLV